MHHGHGHHTPRRGFTLIETLVAVGILVVALGAMAGLAANLTRKARTPNDLSKGAWLAAERLNYFRAQHGALGSDLVRGSVSGFVAAGGTYYPPPADVRLTSQDKNRIGAYHNLDFNRRPGLLVREFVYDTAEVARSATGGDVDHEAARRRAYVPGRAYAVNEIPTTPSRVGGQAVTRVFRNPETSASPPTTVTHPDGTIAIPAPRANDHLRVGASLAEPALRFVREVWSQPMHPLFPAANAASVPVNAPTFIVAPPYGVAVTVRVYLKDPRVKTLAATPSLDGKSGPGLDPRKLLAELVGIVGIM
ncbi:MAG: prepilin-type N-terminal cleavage/methylation domain-containing protein [Candidatus Sericytochromatia bacterium]|nr:prepilin-type N-terminal cleavage/methylation domain-containing protein [Candidatus Sericytochromatia bacterium]